jgi:hypothetical protein
VVMHIREPARPNYCAHFLYLAKIWLPKMKKKYGGVSVGS